MAVGLTHRPSIMAIVNVTPDSFSDGGRFDTAQAALEQALLCVGEGADILDVGAESTRPGHQAVAAQEELARLLPVLEAFKGNITCPVSVDTYKADVAKAALSHGAALINDIWGLQRDAQMAGVVGDSDADIVIMHNRFDGADDTIDILDDMDRWFETSLALASRHGICDQRIILDPGIGFGKTFEQNLHVLAHLDRIKAFGYRTLMGLSRKSFIGRILDKDVDERLFGTLSANLFSLLAGMDIIRVHDVKPHKEAIDILTAIDGAKVSSQTPATRPISHGS